jgi:hypothetical protein
MNNLERERSAKGDAALESLIEDYVHLREFQETCRGKKYGATLYREEILKIYHANIADRLGSVVHALDKLRTELAPLFQAQAQVQKNLAASNDQMKESDFI